MAIVKNMQTVKMPIRAILICCEGKTEKYYFDSIARIFRVTSAHTVEIICEKGTYKSLVDRTVEECAKFAGKRDLDPAEISCWAVCDDDNMPYPYHELMLYAEEHDVRLAFSRPQFEAYILQHFEQSKETNPQRLYRKLNGYGARYGMVGKYEKRKADLSWLYDAIFDNPKLVEIAITNSNQREKQSDDLFLTVQYLTKYLVGLEPK
jgi:hypothetical protein